MGLFFAKVSQKTLWGCSKGGKARCWDCFLGQNDLMALASFNFIALTHKTVVNSGTCGKFIFVPDYISYLCEILLYICPEITFCNLRCDNQANFPPRQQRLDKCHFNDDEHLGFVIGYQVGTFSSNNDEHLVLSDQLKLCDQMIKVDRVDLAWEHVFVITWLSIVLSCVIFRQWKALFIKISISVALVR